MVDKVTNIGASVRDRLRNIAQQRGMDYQIALTRYVLERLLYRLSVSKHRDAFVLKGAMLQAIWLKNPFRHTRDLDLHARGEEDTAKVIEVFRAIFSDGDHHHDDGVVFDGKLLKAEPIRENVFYGGIRVTTTATLGGARIPVLVDIGFGDAITPRPELADYPALLDLPKPRLLVYPRETVIAEKFEAMVTLGLTNSRMKDFHDVAMLASQFEFDGQLLADALTATFKRRSTSLPTTSPPAFSESFTKRLETVALWKAFVTRESIQPEYSDLDAVIGLNRSFLLEPALAAAGRIAFSMRWLAGGTWSGRL